MDELEVFIQFLIVSRNHFRGLDADIKALKATLPDGMECVSDLFEKAGTKQLDKIQNMLNECLSQTTDPRLWKLSLQ